MVLVRSMGLILLPIYTRQLGPIDYGFVEFMAAASAILLLILPLEINQAVARLLPEANTPERLRTLASTAFWFTLAVFSSFGMILFWFRVPTLSAVGLPAAYGALIWLVAANFLVNALINALQVQFRFTGQPYAFVAVNMLVVACNVGLVLFFALTYGLDIRAYFICQICAGIAGLVLGYGLMHRRYGRILSSPRLSALREMLGYSLPLVVSSAGVALTASIDRVSVGRYVGLGELGQYGAALRLAATVGLAFYIISTAMTPIVYREHERPETRTLIATVFHSTLLFSLFALTAATFLAEPIVTFAAGERFAEASHYLFFLVLSTVVANLYVFFLGMDIGKDTRVLGAINLGAGLLGAVACLILVPVFGVWGAIISILLAGSARLAAYIWCSQNRYHITLRYGWPLAATVLLVAYNVARFVAQEPPA